MEAQDSAGSQQENYLGARYFALHQAQRDGPDSARPPSLAASHVMSESSVNSADTSGVTIFTSLKKTCVSTSEAIAHALVAAHGRK